MSKHGFEWLSSTTDKEHYLLEKQEKGKIFVIRVSNQQYNWRRELEKDIEKFEEYYVTKFNKGVFFQKIYFHHILVMDFEPVDEWGDLKKGTHSSPKIQQTNVHTFLDGDQSLDFSIHHDPILISAEFPNNMIDLEQMNHFFQTKIAKLHQERTNQLKQLFLQSKPVWIYPFIIVNIILFFILEMNGGSTNPKTLIQFGAKYNIAIMEGEWWRFITSMFLHIGIMHLTLNMIALYFIGALVERMYGHCRFIFIYFSAGLTGGIASFAFNPQIAAGASGAIFGLFGALLFFGLQYPKIFFKTMGWNVLFILMINIVFGLSVPQIDNGAHLGGLIGGFIASTTVMFPHLRKGSLQVIGAIALALYACGLFSFGYHYEEVQEDETLHLYVIEQQLKEDDYQTVINRSTAALLYAEDYEAELLFYRSYAYLQQELWDKALRDLEKAVSIKPNFEEAYYNLALIYEQNNQMQKAASSIEKAIDINPENEEYHDFYQKLKPE